MKSFLDILLVLPETKNNILSLGGVMKIFESYNQYFNEPFFRIKLTHSNKNQNPEILGNFHVSSDCHFSEISHSDLILVPSLNNSIAQEIENNQKLILWLKKMHKEKNIEIGSMCTGAILLAAAGILNGKEASSHWVIMPELQKEFPKVNWVPEKILTDYEGVYTSGGAISSYNLILYIIEKYKGKEAALTISRFLQIDYNRVSQTPFMVFASQKNHQDKDILKAQEYMENNADKHLTNELLAQRFCMSLRTFNRKFKNATGNSPIRYLQRLRIEKSKSLLSSTSMGINQVMLQVGYTDSTSFRSQFLQHTGQLPSEFRRKFQRSIS